MKSINQKSGRIEPRHGYASDSGANIKSSDFQTEANAHARPPFPKRPYLCLYSITLNLKLLMSEWFPTGSTRMVIFSFNLINLIS